MTVIDFQEAIRARLEEMREEHEAMQDALVHLPQSAVTEHCRRMTEHASEMAKLASRLYDKPSPFPLPEGEGDEPPEAA